MCLHCCSWTRRNGCLLPLPSPFSAPAAAHEVLPMQWRDFRKPRACKHVRFWKDGLSFEIFPPCNSTPVTSSGCSIATYPRMHQYVCIRACGCTLTHACVYVGQGTSRCSHPPGKCWLPPSLELLDGNLTMILTNHPTDIKLILCWYPSLIPEWLWTFLMHSGYSLPPDTPTVHRRVS